MLADRRCVQIMHNGIKVLAGAYHGDWMEEIITRLRGHHEPQEEVIFHEVLRHLPMDATMLEVGSFWAYYSLWFLSEHPGARRAYAIEPDPHNLLVGLANCELNDLVVAFSQAFVAREDCTPTGFETETAGVIEIPGISLPGLLQREGLERLDVVLCDAQGGEVAMLEGLGDLGREGRLGFIVVSTHAQAITGDYLTHQHCLQLVERAGGHVLFEHDVHESFSGDGLIAATFSEVPAGWAPFPVSRNRYSTSEFRNPLYDLALLDPANSKTTVRGSGRED
jgi:FkbM family methyltransferase